MFHVRNVLDSNTLLLIKVPLRAYASSRPAKERERVPIVIIFVPRPRIKKTKKQKTSS
jgi:hypothetical protein